ncbi:MAG: hypothetical protein AB7O50_00655 [Pseudolabrys sp.]
MSVRNIVYIVASPRPRVGKTLVARLITDYQAHNGRAVEAFDLNAPDPALSEYLPERTRVVSIADVKGQMALFDRLVAEDDTTRVVDLGHEAFEAFFRIAADIGFAEETGRRGIAPVILYIGTPDRTSVEAYAALRPMFRHGGLVPVHNEILGNAQYRAKFPASGMATGAVQIPLLSPALRRVVEARPFSFFETPADATARMSVDEQLELQQYLRRVFLEFREMELGVLLADLRSALQA